MEIFLIQVSFSFFDDRQVRRPETIHPVTSHERHTQQWLGCVLGKQVNLFIYCLETPRFTAFTCLEWKLLSWKSYNQVSLHAITWLYSSTSSGHHYLMPWVSLFQYKQILFTRLIRTRTWYIEVIISFAHSSSILEKLLVVGKSKIQPILYSPYFG